jgi:DNA end-binding protein Ku
MAARAIWKGIIGFGDVRVPVKLYSGVQDRNVHFRLLHRKDRQPVRQAMVNPVSDEVVPYQDARRAFVSDNGDLVMLDNDELDALQPAPGREIEIVRFVPQQAIDHRWYERPYYLGPDGAGEDYFALAAALEQTGLEGLARWVMRNKAYVGALRVRDGYPMLVSLRHADEVVPVEALQPPGGKPLDAREPSMARQLIGMLAAEFKPEEYADEYRERVLKLIEDKASGRGVKVVPIRRPKKSEDLAGALEASLKQARSA